jgi:hypothetical protein
LENILEYIKENPNDEWINEVHKETSLVEGKIC